MPVKLNFWPKLDEFCGKKKDLSTPPESENRAFATALMDQVESHADSFIFDSWLPRFEGLDDNDASHGQYGNNGG